MKANHKDKEYDVHFTSYMTPIGTIAISCEFSKDEKIISRGVAICSLRDSFTNKEGKNLAYKRAHKAYLSKRTSGEIKADPHKTYMVKRTIRLKDDGMDNPDNKAKFEFVSEESEKYFWRNEKTLDAYFSHIFPARFMRYEHSIKYKSEYVNK